MADIGEDDCTKEEPTTESLAEFSTPHSVKEEPELDLPSSAENANNMADIGEVKCVELEPELVGIKEEPTNDSTNEFQELPVKIEEESEENCPCDGVSVWTSCWNPDGVKEEWIHHNTLEELDVDPGSVDPLGSCSDSEKNREPSECSELNEEFLVIGEEKTIRKRIKTHTGEKHHVCDICGSEYTTSTSLKYHRRTHTGEKPYICDICGLGFSRNGILKDHMRTHTGDKPYVCDICGLGFKLNAYLKVHVRTHTGERPYVCDVCGLRFTKAGNVKRHKRTHKKT